MTHCHDLFYISVSYHQNIPNGFHVTERTRKCLRTDVQTDVHTVIFLLGFSHTKFLLNNRQNTQQEVKINWVALWTPIRNKLQVLNKYHTQYVPLSGFGQTDARLIAISPETFGRGIKKGY